MCKHTIYMEDKNVLTHTSTAKDAANFLLDKISHEYGIVIITGCIICLEAILIFHMQSETNKGVMRKKKVVSAMYKDLHKLGSKHGS